MVTSQSPVPHSSVPYQVLRFFSSVSLIGRAALTTNPLTDFPHHVVCTSVIMEYVYPLFALCASCMRDHESVVRFFWPLCLKFGHGVFLYWAIISLLVILHCLDFGNNGVVGSTPRCWAISHALVCKDLVICKRN